MTVIQLKRQVITQEVLPISTREYENYDEIRQNFENYLVDECDYVPYVASNTDDGRDDFVKKEYAIYLEMIVKVNPAVKQIKKTNFIKYSEEYPDEARDLLLDLLD